MKLSLDSFTVHCDSVADAADFYTNAFAASIDPHSDVTEVDLHGVGRLQLVEGATSQGSFPKFIVTYIVPQPTDVRTVMDMAARCGAQIVKPAKKALFSSFSGVLRSPDGVIWKIAAESGKDTAPAASEPRPTETTLILGVADPKASKSFYTSLGMQTDRDYGSKYIDFQPVSGSARFCLMQTAVLAKDVGLADDSVGTPPITLNHRLTTSDEIGAQAPIADPDGFRWTLVEDQQVS